MGVDVGSGVAVGRGVVDGSAEGTAVVVGGSAGSTVAVGSGVITGSDTVSDLLGPHDVNKNNEIASNATMLTTKLCLCMGFPPVLESAIPTYEHNSIGAVFSQLPNGYEAKSRRFGLVVNL